METTQEKIISLELTTSPLSDEAPNSISESDSLQADSLQQNSIQPDIVQVVNPLLDGQAGQVTSISVGPSHSIGTMLTEPLCRENMKLDLNTTFIINESVETPENQPSVPTDDENETMSSAPTSPTEAPQTHSKKKKRKRGPKKN